MLSYYCFENRPQLGGNGLGREIGMTSTKVGTDTIAVQIVTTSGNFPADGLRSFNGHEPLHAVLSLAAGQLKLRNTDGWVAKLGDRVLNPQLSLEGNGIPNGSQIFWGPQERGGGAGRCCRN